MAVGALQLVGAIYLMFVIVSDLPNERRPTSCFFGQDGAEQVSRRALIALFLILSWVVVVLQCFTGSDVLRWRSFYATHDMAWKAHYREVFDHGIREALCCLGRAKYMTVLEEDEVYSVARLLGELVAYRASGTGHLELLAGLALLQKHGNLPDLQTDLVEAPHKLMREAAILHPFAEACYTGPLLDVGRNPILFPCAWIYRQGVLTPWARRRRPALDGDNWWRGHAAAFLRFVKLAPTALVRGRVRQSKREAAYFVVVLHDKKTVLIGVRGTETPEDLITDGLCRECAFTMEDLDGLVNSELLPVTTRERVISTFPHYGHGGIVEAARELFMQLNDCTGDNDNSENTSSRKHGFLSTLVQEGSECHGYKIRVVGHSLGGAVATVLGMMLFGRYPDVHVYAYGPLPCVDLVIAEACSQFVTT
ncbi:diacylglycerol lipase-beta-like isoform X4 [Hordeum vulgare subsp. vulgare]|nr:diacylglycerol lipase-beta-like isoform X4 [Hordeum vulgare subsp. vulgare]